MQRTEIFKNSQDMLYNISTHIMNFNHVLNHHDWFTHIFSLMLYTQDSLKYPEVSYPLKALKCQGQCMKMRCLLGPYFCLALIFSWCCNRKWSMWSCVPQELLDLDAYSTHTETTCSTTCIIFPSWCHPVQHVVTFSLEKHQGLSTATPFSQYR